MKLDAFCLSAKQNRSSIEFCNRTHRKVPVRLCPITEPVEQQSDRFGSIDFWLGCVRLTTPDFYKEASETPRVEKGYLHCSADVTNLGLHYFCDEEYRRNVGSLSIDMPVDNRTTLLGRHIDSHSADMWVDMLTDTRPVCQSMCRPIHRPSGAQNTHDQNIFKEWTIPSERPSNSGCTRIIGRAKGSVRDARSAAESISSYLIALPTIQVHPELDGRSLGIVHFFYNIAGHFPRRKVAFSALIKLQVLLTVRFD